MLHDRLARVAVGETGRGANVTELGSHSVVYLVGTALQGLGVLLILPFATRLLGLVEFGKVATGLVVVQMVGTIAGAGLPQVILREHHRGDDGPRVSRALAGAMISLALGLGVIGALVGLVLSKLGWADLAEWLPIVVASASLTTVVAGQTLMRARLRPGGFLALAIAATVLAQLAGLLAARTAPTAQRYLLAYAMVLVVVALGGIALTRPLPPTRERTRVRAGARLAAPLLPQAVAMLGLLMGDVLLTRALLGEAAAGSYQVALQLGNVPFVLAVAFFNAWAPLVLSHPIERRWQWTARTGTALATVVAIGAVGVALVGPWLVAVMTRSEFDTVAIVSALALIASVSVAYMIYQGSSLAVLDAERTGRLAWASAAALAVLVLMAWWLAPAHGIVGIALAKAVGYVVLTVLTVAFARAHSPLRWPPRLVVVWVASGALAVGASLLPITGGGAVVRLLTAAVVVAVALVLAPRVLRVLRG
ncbi:MAG: lipopolysaccharide biosynthesis protein [Terracoccus sp.]